MMTRDIDIREYAVIIKFDHGHEEVTSKVIDCGVNAEGDQIRIILHKDANDKVIRVKVQTL